MKTNKNWYQNLELGSYYKLVNGNLMFCPMLVDGSREAGEGSEVDFELLEGEYLGDELITRKLSNIIISLLNEE